MSKKVCSQRWKIEEFHSEVKQLTGIESCQSRKARIKKKSHYRCLLSREVSQKDSAFNGQNYLPIKE